MKTILKEKCSTYIINTPKHTKFRTPLGWNRDMINLVAMQISNLFTVVILKKKKIEVEEKERHTHTLARTHTFIYKSLSSKKIINNLSRGFKDSYQQD